MKTTIETYEKIKKQVVVIDQDVGILVLLIALTPVYTDILMLKEGKSKIKYRFYSSKDLQNSNLVIECKKNPFSSFMRLVVVAQLQGSIERENYKQCNCSSYSGYFPLFFVWLYNAMMNLSPALSISV
ncbi:hypothetical protein AVEN_238092-1 [Araneus ventricosus]|uniref:Uncharacterized protein n=1 Tax=Araneus ventricosus TaxID=182803 RepID=A0A4Y2KWK0_ARAVE|nr:hypothetical protein AVEN_238092-1 [Araneus ventricosus]